MSLTELMPEEAEPYSVERTVLVMGYELGSIQKSLVYASHKRNQGDDAGENVHLQSARIELAVSLVHEISQTRKTQLKEALQIGIVYTLF